jgi:hypothetical protein
MYNEKRLNLAKEKRRLHDANDKRNNYKAEVCPHAKHELTPCYHKDGEDCLTDDGCCPGCGLSVEYLDYKKDGVIKSDMVGENIRLRQRAKVAEAALAESQQQLSISRSNADGYKHSSKVWGERMETANAAYQRIFDEKAARCEYIAKLEAEMAVMRSLVGEPEPDVPTATTTHIEEPEEIDYCRHDWRINPRERTRECVKCGVIVTEVQYNAL